MYTLAQAITEATCGEACWCAKEDICRCSCGGKNHGVLRGKDGVQPLRTRKLNGYVYELLAVELPGASCIAAGQQPLRDQQRSIVKHLEDSGQWDWHHFESTPGYPVKLKTASTGEVERWPELAGWREEKWYRPLTSWIRIDLKH